MNPKITLSWDRYTECHQINIRRLVIMRKGKSSDLNDNQDSQQQQLTSEPSFIEFNCYEDWATHFWVSNSGQLRVSQRGQDGVYVDVPLDDLGLGKIIKLKRDGLITLFLTESGNIYSINIFFAEGLEFFDFDEKKRSAGIFQLPLPEKMSDFVIVHRCALFVGRSGALYSVGKYGYGAGALHPVDLSEKLSSSARVQSVFHHEESNVGFFISDGKIYDREKNILSAELLKKFHDKKFTDVSVGEFSLLLRTSEKEMYFCVHQYSGWNDSKNIDFVGNLNLTGDTAAQYFTSDLTPVYELFGKKITKLLPQRDMYFVLTDEGEIFYGGGLSVGGPHDPHSVRVYLGWRKVPMDYVATDIFIHQIFSPHEYAGRHVMALTQDDKLIPVDFKGLFKDILDDPILGKSINNVEGAAASKVAVGYPEITKASQIIQAARRNNHAFFSSLPPELCVEIAKYMNSSDMVSDDAVQAFIKKNFKF